MVYRVWNSCINFEIMNINHVNFREWRRCVADEIQRNMRAKEELMPANAWDTIDNICQKTVQDLNSILIELEKLQTKVLPDDINTCKNFTKLF